MTFFGERPDPAQVEAWNRTYLSHRRDEHDRTRCALPDCPSRFPCAARLDAAELLILAGIGVPTNPKLCTDQHSRIANVASPATPTTNSRVAAAALS
ncbi:hypothetical protein [Asanoa iriomotensis]|uniref:Transcription factor WhiB n=1 Tax=Asanoa iriomotensis TaxID=234613 RepID=A0ABQ4CCG3_9ACTN|nr:hypothetical protein [Asanoa iriomotensis]GIF60453.1 hypothetical protein Air01nite_65480 [Asanoa iriomotensis]